MGAPFPTVKKKKKARKKKAVLRSNRDRMITVKVTKGDIEEGFVGDPRECAIAQSFQRMGLDSSQIGVSDTTDFTIEDESFTVSLPPAARKFIKTFDDEKPVKPFSFRLKVPAKVAEAVGQ